ARQQEAARSNSRGIEDLHAFAPVRRIGHGKTAVRRHVEGAWLDDASVFSADLHQLPGRGAIRIDAKDGVPAAIEHVVIAVRGLLESDRLAEELDHMCWKAAY